MHSGTRRGPAVLRHSVASCCGVLDAWSVEAVIGALRFHVQVRVSDGEFDAAVCNMKYRIPLCGNVFIIEEQVGPAGRGIMAKSGDEHADARVEASRIQS